MQGIGFIDYPDFKRIEYPVGLMKSTPMNLSLAADASRHSFSNLVVSVFSFLYRVAPIGFLGVSAAVLLGLHFNDRLASARAALNSAEQQIRDGMALSQNSSALGSIQAYPTQMPCFEKRGLAEAMDALRRP
jgi:hypothetical protein